MLAVGLLSFLSLGLVGMISGGSDAQEEPDEIIPELTDEEANVPLLDVTLVVPAQDEVAAADEVTEDETVDETPAAPVADTTATPPPTGDDYSDPRTIAEAADAQRILDEIAAETARLPVNLVTVTGPLSVEVPDSLVLSDAPGTVDPDDAEFIVTAPIGPNDISVGYDSEHTFQINYTADTTSVAASLNSHIQGPEGTVVQTITEETDTTGVAFTQTSLTQTFAGSTDIKLNVSQVAVGDDIAHLDLSNPADTLHFEFADDITGNYHLVFNEVEQIDEDEGETTVVRSAYVIGTLNTIDVITEEHIVDAMSQGTGEPGVGVVIAEIFLGEDGLNMSTDLASGQVNPMQISNFINETPQISSNLAWASESSYQDLVAGAETSSEDDGFGDLIADVPGLGGLLSRFS